MGKTKFDFSGQVAVVTGASRGIGAASAEAFAEAGAKVYLIDIAVERGEAAAAGIRGEGGDASFIDCDLTDSAAVRQAIERIASEGGRIDIFVNCAGGFHQQLSMGDTSEDEWDAVVDRNLKSVFLTSKYLTPVFEKQNGGCVINLGSMSGLTTLQPSSPPYAAAKAGVHALTRVLAYDLGKHNVRVNAIAPGTTSTERVIAVRSEEQREMIGKGTLLGRIAEVEDVVGWALILASPESAYLTGQTIAVNAGRFMT